ncbi:MAG: hypothetical protein QM765_34525 [Myxococcales bacterium]
MRFTSTLVILGFAACSCGVSFPPTKACPTKTECASSEVCVEMYGRIDGDAGPARELYCRTPCAAASDCADYGRGYKDCYGTCYLGESEAGSQGYCGCLPIE